MRLDIKFEEQSKVLPIQFGEVHEVSDGGYDRGYADGETAGYSNGYTEGEAAGIEQGYENGKSEGIEEGYATGKADGITEGIDQGKTAEWSAFWDAFQQNGTRTDYNYAFTRWGWTETNFKPKYSITSEYGNIKMEYAFSWSTISGDLVEILDKLGITINFSRVYGITQMFRDSLFTRLGNIEFTDTRVLSINYMFTGCKALETIDRLAVTHGVAKNVTFVNAFNDCISLKNITFGGVIGRDISFAASPLTPESMKSVIEHLANYSGTTDAYKYTVTFNADCWAALEADSTAPDGGTWADYVDSLGWNI